MSEFTFEQKEAGDKVCRTLTDVAGYLGESFTLLQVAFLFKQTFQRIGQTSILFTAWFGFRRS
jgi:hypothetical protein